MALLRTSVAVLTALLLAPSVAPTATAAKVPEYDLKAAFLYNFVKFVEWPPGAFTDERTPVTICVFGDDPFGRSLDAVVQGERLGERPLVVQRPDGLDDLGACHVLFVSRSESSRFSEVIAQVRGEPVLTVGDAEGFLPAGGVINFVLAGTNVRFRINAKAAERSGLRLSSKLLRLAMASPGR
jgi:hypothetical protein